MQLVADRLLVGRDGVARDLATGRVVTLVTPPGSPADDEWWAACDRAFDRPDPAGRRLLDAGLLGSTRFEIWDRVDEASPTICPSAQDKRDLDPLARLVATIDRVEPDEFQLHRVTPAHDLGSGVLGLARLLRARGLVPVGAWAAGWPVALRRILRDRSIVFVAGDPGVDAWCAGLRLTCLLRVSAMVFVAHGLASQQPQPRVAERAARYGEPGALLGRSPLASMSAERLRAGAAALARRGALHDAALMLVGLSEILVHRQPRRARAALDDALQLLTSNGNLSGCAEVGARLAALDAEGPEADMGIRRLRAMLEVARAHHFDDIETSVRLVLSKALWYSGRVHEAKLAAERARPVTDAHRATRLRRLARAAASTGRLAEACALGNEALELAERIGDDAMRSAAHDELSRVHGALRNWTGVRTHVEAGLRLAGPRTSARRRRLLLSLAEGAVACRRSLTGRQRRWLRTQVERRSAAFDGRRARGILRAAASQLQESAGTARRVSDERGISAAPDETVMTQLIEILRICHESRDEQTALDSVASVVQRELRSSGVAVYDAGEPPALVAQAGAAAPAAPPVVARALSARVFVCAYEAPVLEAAGAISYLGRPIGVIWVGLRGSREIDERTVSALLPAVAEAVAPIVQAWCDRRSGRDAVSDETVGIVGVSRAARELRHAIRRAAQAPFPALILGESGAGKEVVARAIHQAGPRRSRRFCAINCAAITDELLESELFGHVKGAYTGALIDRAGMFEEADGGTLFLDEVGELSPRGQAKLLRVLQEHEIRRVGESLSRKVDVRVVAATNRPLDLDAETGRFRQDLLYRLDVVRLHVPSLRDRPEDIGVLARQVWHDVLARTGSRAHLHPDVVAALSRYHWPGNVRELQNVMAALAVRAPLRGLVTADVLPAALQHAATLKVLTLDEARRQFEVQFVTQALARAGGRRAVTASALGISRQGLAKLLVRLGLDGSSSEGGVPS